MLAYKREICCDFFYDFFGDDMWLVTLVDDIILFHEEGR